MPSIIDSYGNGDVASADWHTKKKGQSYYGYMGTYVMDDNVLVPVFWQYGPTLSDKSIKLSVRDSSVCGCAK